MTTFIPKSVQLLQTSDLEKYSVWQFVNDDEADDTAVIPVRTLPISTLNGKMVGTRVRLANGNSPWALLGNLDAKDSRLNEHFVTLSVERNGKWFDLARYHDFDFAKRGPKGLAKFLNLPVDAVFPISYDVSPYAKGDPLALKGMILKEPRVRLTRTEIIALAVP